MLAVLVGVAVSRHFHQSGGERTLALLLLAPFASLPLAVRRRWPVPVFFIVLAASVAYGVLGARVSTVTGPTYALYTVAVQADRTWSLLALAAVEAAALVNGAEAGFGVNVTLARASKGNTVNVAFTALVQHRGMAHNAGLAPRVFQVSKRGMAGEVQGHPVDCTARVFCQGSREGHRPPAFLGLAHPVDDHDPDDPVGILSVLPEEYHAQFLIEYAVAVEGARRPEQFRQLQELWRLRAVAYSSPGYDERLAAVRRGRAAGFAPAEYVIPGWAGRGPAAPSVVSRLPRSSG